MKSFWISCIGNLDKATESLVKVTEASKNMPSVTIPISDEVDVSKGYTCTTVNDDAENGIEVNQTPSLGNDVEDVSAAAANCTPMVHTHNLKEESIDLNRTVPHRTYTDLDFDPPSFDLNIDYSPSNNTGYFPTRICLLPDFHVSHSKYPYCSFFFPWLVVICQILLFHRVPFLKMWRLQA